MIAKSTHLDATHSCATVSFAGSGFGSILATIGMLAPLIRMTPRIPRVIGLACLTILHCASANEGTKGATAVTLTQKLGIRSSRTLVPEYTSAAWSKTSGLIAVSEAAAKSRYIVDPETGAQVEFTAELPGGDREDLMWSSTSPRLTIARGRSIETIAAQPTGSVSSVHKQQTLDFHGVSASLVEQSGHEFVVAFGATSSDPSRSTKSIQATRLSDGKQHWTWRFPDDGAHYQFRNGSAIAIDKAILAVGWAVRYVDQRIAHQLWVVDSRTALQRCVIQLGGDLQGNRDVSTVRPALTADGALSAVATSSLPYVTLYRNSTCSEERRLPLPEGPQPTYLTFSPDGRWLLGTAPVSQGEDPGRIYMWDTRDWRLVYVTKQRRPYQGAFDPSSRRFVIATEFGVYIYHISTKD
ncbi:hypothetical protein HLB44_00230 [Aquincola sp. S2]|uniref:WD40 repeat domain-containing protein n=1 Tax=Pseudaquabacterium terrae TaxID=2732868 RepID=A0ABX2EAH7_9BURK|nr:hypothetical protein [Aquabacterium terrae]NRF65399.1 hypothetical protein [Aquabacterium terrae]